MEGSSRFAMASAAPGFERATLRLFSLPFPWSSPATRRFFVGFAGSSASLLSSAPVWWCRAGRSRLATCPFSRSFFSRGGPPPPRRTASSDAYSTTSFRPLRWWFRGLVSVDVACSVLVKSTKAHLLSDKYACGQLLGSKADTTMAFGFVSPPPFIPLAAEGWKASPGLGLDATRARRSE